MNNIEREEFLEWWESRHYDDEDKEVKKAAWCAWQAARQAPACGEVEPVAWTLKWPESDSVNAPTTFSTEDLARRYAEGCQDMGVAVIPLYTHPPAKVPEYDLVADYARCLETLGCKLEVGEELPVCLGDMLDELLTTPTPATTAEADTGGCKGNPSNGCAHCEPEHGCQANQCNVPAGWKLVPIESTSEMDIAGMDSMHNSYEGYVIDRDAAETIWSAMVSATPAPPQEQ